MASRADALVAQHFPGSACDLVVGGVPIGEIAERFGTPLFVYDGGVLARKWDVLRSTLPPSYDIYYSVKANPNGAIVEFFVKRGAGLEVASGGELLRALAAGCAAERILFAGPGKTEAELELALSRGIGEIHVESPVEVRRIARVAGRVGLRARIALRVNPASEVQGGAMRMGGKAAPFGIDEEKLEEVVDLVLKEPLLDLRGAHLFTGTQILDHTVLIAQYRRGLEIGARIAERTGRPLDSLDFGGGLGIPYFDGETDLDMGKLGEELRGLMAGVAGDGCFVGTRFVVEPGRYLVGESGVYLVRINDVKVSRGKTFYIVDGGMNHHLAASGNLGQVIKRNFPMVVVNRLDGGATRKVDVVGPLCTPLDTLAREISLPVAEVGDLIGILQSGAYGLTASPVWFLSHGVPAEVLVAEGRVQEVRRRTSWEQYLG